jgi:predicted transcriptional regulator
MSIHPEFATRILAGEKRVEFRRRSGARELSHILVYATSPVCAVIGVAEIDRLEQASPRLLWQAFGSVGGIGRSRFFAYFAGVGRGAAYVIRRTWLCSTPIPLGRHGLPRTPPQAFQYIATPTLDAVLRRCNGLSVDESARAVG